jgi:hypothetical protein
MLRVKAVGSSGEEGRATGEEEEVEVQWASV